MTLLFITVFASHDTNEILLVSPEWDLKKKIQTYVTMNLLWLYYYLRLLSYDMTTLFNAPLHVRMSKWITSTYDTVRYTIVYDRKTKVILTYSI